MFATSKFICLFLLAILLAGLASPAPAMERRRDQFMKEPGHYIIPVPISYPGLGEALAIGGIYANAHDSYTDYGAFIIGGDIEGYGAAVSDLHLIDRTLIAELAAERLSRVAVYNYRGRGMETNKDDYGILELDKVQTEVARLRGTFYNRMFEIVAMAINNEVHLASLRDKNGGLILDTRDSEASQDQYLMTALLFDWTDDYQDPHRGVRYSLSRWWQNNVTADAPAYYQLEHNLTAYIPIGRISTWAFNYFRSNAVVSRMGDTDFASVERM